MYFSALGTLFITNRPSYDSDANTHGSAVDHSTAYTLSSCSSNVAMTPSFVGSRDLEHQSTTNFPVTRAKGNDDDHQLALVP